MLFPSEIVLAAYPPLSPPQTTPVPPSIGIDIELPIQNNIYHTPQISLRISVNKPTSYAPSTDISSVYAPGTRISSVYYIVDDGERQNISNLDVFSENNNLTATFLVSLNLKAGAHSVQAGVDGIISYGSPIYAHAVTQLVNFTVKLPEPTIVAPQQQRVYNQSDVPLTFRVDLSAASWVGYSLDGKDNVTLSGNTTLTGLLNGVHNVAVYANDTYGNIGASETVNFNVALPTAMNSFPTATVAVVFVAALVVMAAGLLYFKKHRQTEILSQKTLTKA